MIEASVRRTRPISSSAYHSGWPLGACRLWRRSHGPSPSRPPKQKSAHCCSGGYQHFPSGSPTIDTGYRGPRTQHKLYSQQGVELDQRRFKGARFDVEQYFTLKLVMAASGLSPLLTVRTGAPTQRRAGPDWKSERSRDLVAPDAARTRLLRHTLCQAPRRALTTDDSSILRLGP